MLTAITGNGIFTLNTPGEGETVNRESVSVYRDADGTAATVEIGFMDSQGSFSPFANGQLGSGEAFVVECGRGVELAAQVAGFVSSFNINVTS